MNYPAKRLSAIVASSVISVCGTLGLADETKSDPQGEEVAVAGKIVDLQCSLSGQYPSADKQECAKDCIASGVPAALDTAEGLIILGTRNRELQREIAQHAHKDVEVKGTMFRRGELKYLDITSVTKKVAMIYGPQLPAEEMAMDPAKVAAGPDWNAWCRGMSNTFPGWPAIHWPGCTPGGSVNELLRHSGDSLARSHEMSETDRSVMNKDDS